MKCCYGDGINNNGLQLQCRGQEGATVCMNLLSLSFQSLFVTNSRSTFLCCRGNITLVFKALVGPFLHFLF